MNHRAHAGGCEFSLFSIFFFQIEDVPDYKGGEENAIIILNNNIIIVYVEIIHMDAINPYLVQCDVHGRTGDCFWDAGSAVWIWTDQ